MIIMQSTSHIRLLKVIIVYNSSLSDSKIEPLRPACAHERYYNTHCYMFLDTVHVLHSDFHCAVSASILKLSFTDALIYAVLGSYSMRTRFISDMTLRSLSPGPRDCGICLIMLFSDTVASLMNVPRYILLFSESNMWPAKLKLK